jgi:hypothetical protein
VLSDGHRVSGCGILDAIAPSLFRRLRQYGTTPGRYPREDQLTEALAATLDAAPNAAQTLVERVFDSEALPDVGACRVRSQPDPGEHGCADLELAFGPKDQPVLRVWVENKVDSAAYRSQGERYMCRLEELRVLHGGEWRFAWLLRVGHEVEGEAPGRASVVTWQDVASQLHEWRGDQEDQESYATRLVAEFVKHLEEERLGHTRALSERDALALNWYEEAQLSAQELVEQARALVRQRWEELDPLKEDVRQRNSLWFWRHYAKHGPERSPRWPEEGSWFEWHARRDAARNPENQRGEVVFGTGVVFLEQYAPREGDEGDEESWLRRFYSRGFEYGGDVRGHHLFLFRYRSLDELVGLPDIGAQAQALADFVVESWEMLEDDPPPRP